MASQSAQTLPQQQAETVVHVGMLRMFLCSQAMLFDLVIDHVGHFVFFVG